MILISKESFENGVSSHLRYQGLPVYGGQRGTIRSMLARDLRAMGIVYEKRDRTTDRRVSNERRSV